MQKGLQASLKRYKNSQNLYTSWRISWASWKNINKFTSSHNTMKHFLVLLYFTEIDNRTQYETVTYKVQKHLQCHRQRVLGQSLPLNLVYLFCKGLRIVAPLLSVTSKSHTLSGPLCINLATLNPFPSFDVCISLE